MTGPRVPPRFVPTLTTVLEPFAPLVPSETPSTGDADNMPATGAAAPVAPADPLPPLPTTVVSAMPNPRELIALDPATRFSEMERFALEEQLLHRVMQRVDLQLEERLSEVVAAAVQAQLDQMVPRLREEIEDVLRTLVTEALAQELQDKPGSNPPENGRSFS